MSSDIASLTRTTTIAILTSTIANYYYVLEHPLTAHRKSVSQSGYGGIIAINKVSSVLL